MSRKSVLWERACNLVPFVLMMLILTLAPASAGAQLSPGQPPEFIDHPGWPDTRVGRLARELVDIINTKDRERAFRFIQENYDPEAWKDFPADQNAEWLSGIVRQPGAWVFHGTRTYPKRASENEILVIMQDETTEAWRGVTLTLDTNPPHKIRGLTVMPAPPPADLREEWAALDPEQFVDDLEAYLDRMTAEGRFSGAVLVARHDDVLFRKAYGLASRRFDVPNREDTLFNLASMNKMFTAVAVMQLVEAGKLDLDVTVDRYLPEGWLAPEVAGRITVRQLLTHTAGLGDYLAAMWDQSRLRYRNLDDYRPLVADTEPAFEPGTEWAYSNSGFLLLGVIVQQVSNTPYLDYVRKHVFEPAGMSATDSYDMDWPVPNLAIGYSLAESEGKEVWQENSLQHTIKGGPAGGGYSTVDDLFNFACALRGSALVSQASKDLLWTATELSKQRWPYGYGFDIRGRDGDRVVGHGGSFPGISSDLEIWLDRGWIVVVLSNTDGGAMLVRPKIDHDLRRVVGP